MRIGYGYRRTEKDFDGASVEDIYIDTPSSDRAERYKMLVRGGMRDGDTLVMLGKGDLGYGKELQRLRKRLEEMNVEVEYVEDDPPPKGARGRPRGFKPSDEADAEIKAAWHDEDRTVTYVFKIAASHGLSPALHQLKYRYGNRFPDDE